MLGASSSIDDQVSRLSGSYPGVRYDSETNTVTMPYRLNAEFDGCQIVEDYRLRIVLHDGYPSVLPSVYEESGKICDEFAHRYPDGSLCVGVPGELHMDSPDGIELVDFIDGPVKSCLYSAAFLERYGRYPFGERSHGWRGILEYYCELFGVESLWAAASLMGLVATGDYRGNDKCPCGSGKQIWKCHGKVLRELSIDGSRQAVAGDYMRVASEAELINRRRQLSEAVRANLQTSWGFIR